MITVLLILFIVSLLLVLIVMVTRLSVTIAIHDNTIEYRFLIARCGLVYYRRDRRLRLSCFGHELSLPRRPASGRARSERKKTSDHKPARPKLPLRVRVQTGKAALLFVGRLLARVQYNIGEIDIAPVFANPALAGMAYGWGRAFSGAFPGAARSFRVTPSFTGGTTRFSGSLTLSIASRQICYLVYRLWRDLPIQHIMKHRFFR